MINNVIAQNIGLMTSQQLSDHTEKKTLSIPGHRQYTGEKLMAIGYYVVI